MTGDTEGSLLDDTSVDDFIKQFISQHALLGLASLQM